MSAAPAIALATPLAPGNAVRQIVPARAIAYLLPYFIGAMFGGAVGIAILTAPLSIGNGIDLAITMAILLSFCWFWDLGGKMRRSFLSRG